MSGETEAKRLGWVGQWAGMLVVAAATAAWCLFYLDYGLGLRDEGTLLSEFLRVARGDVLYRDLHIGYSPPFYLLQGWILRTFGESITAVRGAMAVAHVLGACFLFRLMVAAGARPGFALAAGLSYVTVLPVYYGRFAMMNTPYPAWYNAALWVAGMYACLRFARGRSSAWALAAGAAAGLAFSCKPNVGVFQLAATALLVLAALPLARDRHPRDAYLWWAWWGATLCGLVGVFAGAPAQALLWPILGPAVACALLVVPTALAVGRSPDAGTPRVLATALLVGGAFAALTVPWVAHYYLELGHAAFLERVLFLGGNYEQWFFVAHPPVRWWVLAAAVGAIALLASPVRVAALGWSSVRLPALALAAGAVAALVAGAAGAFGPEPLGWLEERFAAERFAVSTLVLATAVGFWAEGLVLGTAADALGRAAIAVSAAFGYLQVYPRTDEGHWVMVAAPLVAAALYLGSRLADRWLAGAASRPVALAGAAAFALPALLPVLLSVGAAANASLVRDGSSVELIPQVRLENLRAPVRMEAGSWQEYRHLAEVASFVEARTAPDERIFTFPSIDILYFLAGRLNATRRGYFFPGWVGHDVEAEVEALLRREPPRYVVVLNASSLHFTQASIYYFGLMDFLAARYRRERAFGPYVVLARNDVPAEPGPDLVDVPPPAAVADLVAALRGADDEGLSSALHRLEAIRPASTLPVVEALLHADSAAVRDAAAMALRFSRDPRTSCELLRAAWAGALSNQTSIALAGIGVDGFSPDCASELLQHLADLPPRLRLEAPRMLATLAFEPLREMATTGRRPERSGFPSMPLANLSGRMADIIRRGGEFPILQAFGVVWSGSLPREARVDALRWAQFAFDARAGVLASVLLEREGAGDASVLQRVLPYMFRDSIFGPWAVLQFARRPEFDRILADYIRTAPSQLVVESLWIAAVAGGSLCETAARERLAEPFAGIRRAATWTLLRRGVPDSAALLQAAAADEDVRLREIAAAWTGSDMAVATRGPAVAAAPAGL